MLSYSADTGWVSHFFQGALMITFIAFSLYQNRVRRKSLRRQEDGLYVWIEWHGGERSSYTDPSAAGGAWDSDGDGDGGD
ncbi:hypothetical protein J7400_12800 [Shimia sp. R9_2]|uniref:hypothetical protein n=1 Tax=Shimia sp. R9_2 TaxID=2821112 RepID=UPI001ADCB6C9|nr:hypothetical protein [Shimia sp. R9_2]MBO9397559.1 hypothetical protein [Shimia sp. R9_2]